MNIEWACPSLCSRMLIMALAFLSVAPVPAGEIGLAGFSGSESVIDFDGFPTPAPGPFTLGPITFSEASTIGGPGWRVLDDQFGGPSDVLTDDASISDILLEFAAPVQRAGLVVGIGDNGGTTTYEVTFYGSGLALLGSVQTSVFNELDSNFVGWEEITGITQVRILELTGNNSRVGGITDVRWELNIDPPAPLPVLGPAALGLLALGLVALAGRALKQRA